MNLLEAILELGPTKEIIASNLQRHGVKGRKASASCCPVACYLHQKGFLYPQVSLRTILSENERIVTPTAVSEFVTYFDMGEFPELDSSVTTSPTKT